VSGRRIPVTDAEIEKYRAGRPDAKASPERTAAQANIAETRAELDRVGELIDRIPDRQAEVKAEARAAAGQQ
jgi:hypothetical protein